MENTCRNCGGELIEKNSYYECDCCGKRYEKAVSKPEKPNEEPGEKTFPFVGDEKNETLSKITYLEGYAVAFLTEDCEYMEDAIKTLKRTSVESVDYIEKIESAEKKRELCSVISGKILGAIYYLNLLALEGTRPGGKKETETDNEFIARFMKLSALKETREKELDSAAAAFIRRIWKITDASFAKMAAERAADIFAVNLKKQTRKVPCPEIEKIWNETKVEITDFYQRKLTVAYWEKHKEEFEKLESERIALEKEINGYNKFVGNAKKESDKKAAEIQKDFDAAEKRLEEIRLHLNNLNFFQFRKKEKLIKEQDELFVTKKNLENKVKYIKSLGERKAEDFRREHKTVWFEAGVKLTRIEQKLEMNRYPGEELFDETLENEIKFVRKKFGYDKFD